MNTVILTVKDIAPLTPMQQRYLADISKIYARREQYDATNPVGLGTFKMLNGSVDELVLDATRRDATSLSPVRSVQQRMMHIERLIGSLRDKRTDMYRFRELTTQAYQFLFAEGLCSLWQDAVLTTPVTVPSPQRALAPIPHPFENEEFCIGVVLRAGLLPALVTGDEIQRASGKSPSYALFRISRTHGTEPLGYLTDSELSCYRGEDIEGRHFLIADPMLATGGSLIALAKILGDKDIHPKKTTVMPMFAAVDGIFNLRNNCDAEIVALRTDPLLNNIGYILPGCGDAGDRLMGPDCPAEVTEMLKRLGPEFCTRYRAQVERVYETLAIAPAKDLFK